MEGFEALTSNAEQFQKELIKQVKAVQGLKDRFKESGSEAYDAFVAFINAVDWTERWIQGVLAMHLVLLVIVTVYRRDSTVQLTIFTICIALVALSQPLNSVGAEYWDLFASQPYFDKNGAFITAILSSPLVVVMIVILINCALIGISDMVMLKRRQLAKGKKAVKQQ